MKKILLLSCFLIFAYSGLSASDQLSVSFSKFKKLLTSDTYNGKKKAAFIQLYLKTNKTIDEDGILFFQEFMLNPKVCTSKEVFKTVASFLIQNNHITQQFEGKIKKTINDNLEESDYIVWCLEFLRTLTFYSSNSDGTNGKKERVSEKQHSEQFDAINRYISEIYKKTNYQIFVAVIKQKSNIIWGTEGIVYEKEKNINSILKALIEDIGESKNYNLLKYINGTDGWGTAFIKKKDFPLFIRIADDSSLPENVRNEASSILSRIFYINKDGKITWSDWYAENSNSFNRIEVAKKAILNTELPDDIRVVALGYIAGVSEKPTPEFLDSILEIVKSTNSIMLCFNCSSTIENYLEKSPENKKINDVYKETLKNCRRLYRDYEPSPDDEVVYYIPEETPASSTDSETKDSGK